MGWNRVRADAARHPLWLAVPDGAWFYFVHSFYAAPTDPRHSAGETDYGARFTSAVARDNIFATQFHPEKSAAARPRPVPQLPALEALSWPPAPSASARRSD